MTALHGHLLATAFTSAVALAELDLLIQEMDARAPWAHPKASELDSITWEAWMRKRLSPEALIYVNRGYAPGLSDAPSRVSMLHAVYLGKTGGGLINGRAPLPARTPARQSNPLGDCACGARQSRAATRTTAS